MARIHNDDGRVEAYDGQKIKAGIMTACNAVMTPLGAAEQFASEVEFKISNIAKKYSAVTARDLKRLTKNVLNNYHADAAEVYAIEEGF